MNLKKISFLILLIQSCTNMRGLDVKYKNIEQFKIAINASDFDEAIRLIPSMNVNGSYEKGITPLMLISKVGRFWANSPKYREIVMALIESGAEVNAEDEYGNTPLHWAVKGGRREVAEALIEREATIDARDRDGFTPLITAAVDNRDDMFRTLLQNGADINTTSNSEWTAEMFAKQNNYKKILELISQHR